MFVENASTVLLTTSELGAVVRDMNLSSSLSDTTFGATSDEVVEEMPLKDSPLVDENMLDVSVFEDCVNVLSVLKTVVSTSSEVIPLVVETTELSPILSSLSRFDEIEEEIPFALSFGPIVEIGEPLTNSNGVVSSEVIPFVVETTDLHVISLLIFS